LSTIYGIIRQNRGHIECSSEPGKGTTFTIYFPRHQEAGTETFDFNQNPPPPAENGAILLVDDEPELLNLVERILEKQGFSVFTAHDAETALEIAARYADRIALLLTDIRLPKMSGFSLGRHLSEAYPNMKSLFMSGYTDWQDEGKPVSKEEIDFIAKPFSIKDLLGAVQKALG